MTGDAKKLRLQLEGLRECFVHGSWQEQVLTYCLELTYRAGLTKPRAPREARHMDGCIGDLARGLVASDPFRSTLSVGRQLGVNPGRVSEALQGFWQH
jgi:hypothetical protein